MFATVRTHVRRHIVAYVALFLLAVGPATAEATSRVVGDFDGDGNDDLAVGVPGEDLDAIEDAGAVNVIYGSASRLTATDDQLWHQDSAGIEDAAEDGDLFGEELAAGDFNGSGHDDVVVGVPREDVASIGDAGAANVLYGAGVGLRADGNQRWHQNSVGIEDATEADDFFGNLELFVPS